jgi:hypothetical protein
MGEGMDEPAGDFSAHDSNRSLPEHDLRRVRIVVGVVVDTQPDARTPLRVFVKEFLLRGVPDLERGV